MLFFHFTFTLGQVCKFRGKLLIFILNIDKAGVRIYFEKRLGTIIAY